MIYFDNAATGYPKPPCVIEAVNDYLLNTGASSGRAGHRMARKTGKIIFSCRENLAKLFNVLDSSGIVFTSGATESINTVLFGFLREGDEVVTTSMEHNSVMRPLRYLEREKKIKIVLLNADKEGMTAEEEFALRITDSTRLTVINHASNVTGSLVSLKNIKDLKKNSLLLVDAAQSAGVYPIDVEEYGIDFLAFTGHKGLMGPTGTGGLYVREKIDLRPLKLGGTGSISEKEEQPDFYPDRLEAGTLNTTGIAGLKASTDFLLEKGVENIYEHKKILSRYFIDKFSSIEGVEIYGPCDPEKALAVFSINIKGRDPSEIAFILDRKYDIAVRVGLHCAPAAHRTTGTYPLGTVRISPGYFNTALEIDFLSSAIKEILKERKIF